MFASCPPRHEVFEEIPENVEPVDGRDKTTDNDCVSDVIGGSTVSETTTVSTGEEAVERPDELPLFDNEGKPIRPKRDMTKKWANKRENRLLSVPHIKYQKNDGNFSDLRSRDEGGGGPSFAGNLMRRFSKCLYTKLMCMYILQLLYILSHVYIHYLSTSEKALYITFITSYIYILALFNAFIVSSKL